MAKKGEGKSGGENPWTVNFLRTRSGDVPTRRFLAGLVDLRHKADADALLALALQWGNRLALLGHYSAPVGNGVFELRGHQVRFFYVFRPGRRIVVLYGIVKKSTEIPKEQLDLAQRYRRGLEEQERAEKKRRGGP